MQVLADRAQTGGLRLLQYDSELFLLFSLVQGTSLATNGASLAESLYGLRRTSAAAAQRGHAHSLSIKQLLLSCFFLVCYINICDIHTCVIYAMLEARPVGSRPGSALRIATYLKLLDLVRATPVFFLASEAT